jgi:hypothetical protein
MAQPQMTEAISLTQRLASQKRNESAQAEQALMAAAAKANNQGASSYIGMQTLGTNQLLSAAKEYDQNGVDNYNRQKTQENNNREHTLYQQETAQKQQNWQATHDLSLAEQARLAAADKRIIAQEEGTRNRTQSFDALMDTAMQPFTQVQKDNALYMQQAQDNPDIQVSFDPDTGVPVFKGANPEAEILAKDLYSKLTNSDIVGNKLGYSDQVKALQEKLNGNKNVYDDVTNAQAQEYINKYVSNIGSLYQMDDGQKTRLAGKTSDLNTAKTKEYETELGTSNPDNNEMFKSFNDYDAAIAKGENTYDPTAGFFKKFGKELEKSKSVNYVHDQLQNAFEKAQTTYADKYKSKTTRGKAVGKDNPLKWNSQYEKLAYQRALENSTIDDRFWEIGNNEVDKGKLVKAIQHQMDLIVKAEGNYAKKKAIDTKYANALSAATFNIAASAGNVKKDK